MPTNEEIIAYGRARWDEVHSANVKATQATLLLLAQRAREEYPTATGIRLGDSDQGQYMTYTAMLDATGTDLDENGDFDDDGDCSAFDDSNADTWQTFCIEGPNSRRHNADWVIQIDQVLAAGSTLIEQSPTTIEAVEAFLTGDQPVPIPDDLRLSFTPDAIREHFEGDDPDPTEHMTDEELADVGRTALLDDGLYRAFHEALTWALEDNDAEPDGAPCCPDPDCPGRGRATGCTFPGYADNH